MKLEARALTKRFGALTALDNVSLDVREGECHAVIGPNGAGKTTLIGLLDGTLAPDSGSVRLAGRDITTSAPHERARHGLGRTFQTTSVFAELSALDNVITALLARAHAPLPMRARVAGATPLFEQAHALLAQVGLAREANQHAHALAHGAKKRLELAMTLATDPHVLLLDEPMAGLTQAETVEMTALLATLKQRTALLLVEHDMDAVFQLADRLSVLAGGRVIASGPPRITRADPEARRVYFSD